MSRLLARWRKFGFSAIAVAWWIGLAGLACGASAPGQPAPEPPPAWVPCYALVIFSIGIGLAVLLTSAKRRDRAKPEVFSEQK